MRCCATMMSLAFLLFATLSHASIELIANGKSDYVIVVDAAAPGAAHRGAREIQSHLKRMTGLALPIIPAEGSVPSHGIFIGESRYLEPLGVSLDRNKLGDEGFILKTAGPHIVIAGAGARGTMYGCTEFLERLGVRFFAPDVTRVPRRSSVAVPDLDETQTPAFEFREIFFTEAQQKDWAARLRLNGQYVNADESTGGHIVFGRGAHSLDELIPQQLFDSHPEYFPLINGKRTGGYVQRCLANPDVLKLAIAGVQRWITENPQATIFSVSQNDTDAMCECDACHAIEQRFGGQHAGLYVWFANQVAKAIEKDHPDKLIDTLAYRFTEAPPAGIAPRKHVRVRLCPLDVCQAHPYEKCPSPRNRDFIERLRAWAALTDKLYLWHYNTNFHNYLMPFPDFDEFPADARLYHALGVKGIFFQGDGAPGGGGSDAALRSYVMSKLLWNPNLDADALVNEWMGGVYGPAAKPMRAWFELLHEKVRPADVRMGVYDAPRNTVFQTRQVIDAGRLLFDEAEKLATNDPIARQYVARARLSLRYMQLMQDPNAAAIAQFLNEVRKWGITQIREGLTLEEWEKTQQ